jgi:hypothetical protein
MTLTQQPFESAKVRIRAYPLVLHFVLKALVSSRLTSMDVTRIAGTTLILVFEHVLMSILTLKFASYQLDHVRCPEESLFIRI